LNKSPELLASGANLVFGVGTVDADLMFVGEAPGEDEDRKGEPFVGKAGQLLMKIIQATGLDREKVYIANVLKYRPDTPGKSFGNRKPRPDEIESWFPFLMRQIEIIQPKVIVGLGATAVEGLLGHMPTGITRLRGNWQSYRSVPVMPTFHPSYLLRNQSWAVKRQVWEDMMQVMERLNMPISEKQKGFFLRK
jgi:DNA polymerase